MSAQLEFIQDDFNYQVVSLGIQLEDSATIFQSFSRGMSIVDYSLNITYLSKYSPTMVAVSMDEINKFFMAISHFVVNQCRQAMSLPRMDISYLTIYVEKIEEQKLK